MAKYAIDRRPKASGTDLAYSVGQRLHLGGRLGRTGR